MDAGQTAVIRLRLSKITQEQSSYSFGKDFDAIFTDRLKEADEFYQSVTPPSVNKDAANVMGQAIAGMLWSTSSFSFLMATIGWTNTTLILSILDIKTPATRSGSTC